jgi:hypothetical protein
VTSADPTPAATPARGSLLPAIKRRVPGRDPRFTGRVELIDRIHRMLVSSAERAVFTDSAETVEGMR